MEKEGALNNFHRMAQAAEDKGRTFSSSND